MKLLSSKLPSVALLAVAFSSAPAAIVWTDPGTPIAYTPGTSVGLTADPSTGYAGIGTDFSSNQNGSFDVAPGGRQLCFVTGADIDAGTPIELFFDFSHMLGSGGVGAPPPRAASKFRLANGTSVTVDTLMYGGNDTLQNYWGANTTGPLTSNSNGGILEFQDVFMRDPADPTYWYGQGPTSAIFQGFSNPNTATITGGDTNTSVQSIDSTALAPDTIDGNDHTLFDIVDPGRSSIDLSFSGWRYTVTPNETLPSGSKFLFTFEGVIIADRIGIPEPSRAVLLAGGLLLLGLRRRR